MLEDNLQGGTAGHHGQQTREKTAEMSLDNTFKNSDVVQLRLSKLIKPRNFNLFRSVETPTLNIHANKITVSTDTYFQTDKTKKTKNISELLQAAGQLSDHIDVQKCK